MAKAWGQESRHQSPSVPIDSPLSLGDSVFKVGFRTKNQPRRSSVECSGVQSISSPVVGMEGSRMEGRDIRWGQSRA